MAQIHKTYEPTFYYCNYSTPSGMTRTNVCYFHAANAKFQWIDATCSSF